MGLSLGVQLSFEKAGGVHSSEQCCGAERQEAALPVVTAERRVRGYRVQTRELQTPFRDRLDRPFQQPLADSHAAHAATDRDAVDVTGVAVEAALAPRLGIVP